MAQTDGTQEELCKQVASLVVRREQLDADALRGKEIDTLEVVRIAGAINRTMREMKRHMVDPEADRKRRKREREDREAGLAS